MRVVIGTASMSPIPPISIRTISVANNSPLTIDATLASKEASWKEAREGYLEILGLAELALECYVLKKQGKL